MFKLKPDWMPQPLILLALSHMVTDLSQGALPMLLPSLKTALDLSYTQIGLLVLVQNVTSSIIQPIFGAITDKMSLPWLLPVSVFLSGLGMAITGFMTSYQGLMFAVVVGGLEGVAKDQVGMPRMQRKRDCGGQSPDVPPAQSFAS